jgi:Pvc16 N-terminal domain
MANLMANVSRIHSVGNSLVTFLRNTYPSELRQDHPCLFDLISSGELVNPNQSDTRLTFFLHRLTTNEHLRNASRVNGRALVRAPLTVDLHYLMTVWTDNALTEQLVLTWAMRQLHIHSALDISSLRPEGQWEPGDVINILPGEISNEDMMRIWDALNPPYRLSVSYVARPVRIDVDEITDARPVVATRFSYINQGAPP